MKLQLKELRSIVRQVISEADPSMGTAGSEKVVSKIEGSSAIDSAMKNIKNAADLQGLITGILNMARDKGIDTQKVLKALSGTITSVKKDQSQQKKENQ